MATQNPITALKQSKGLNRAEIARKMGISYMSLSQIEGGLVTTLNRKTAMKIAEFAGKNPDDVKKEFEEWRESLKQAA